MLRRGVVLLLLAPLAVATTAGAQLGFGSNAAVDVPNQPAPIAPGSTLNLSVGVRYSWGPAGGSPQPTTVTLQVLDQPPWLNATFIPESFEVDTLDFGQNRTGGLYGQLVNLTLSVAADAPAFAVGTVTVQVDASAAPPYPSATSQSSFDVSAGFLGAVQARLVQAPVNGTIGIRGGWDEAVDVEITNLGNGPLLVVVEATRTPAESKWEIAEIRLGTAPAERTGIARVPVRTPWRVSFEQNAEITVTPAHAERGVEGAPVVLPFVVHGQSAVPIPGPAAALLPLAVAGAAWAARRQRR